MKTQTCFSRILQNISTSETGSNSYTTGLRVFFWTSLLLICSITFYTGVVPVHMFGHDTFFLLDNGWRVLNGHRPHIEFSSAWGPVTFLVIGLGLKLSQFSVDGIGYGCAFFTFIIASWCYFLCRNRLHSPIQVIASLTVAVLVCAPYALGTGAFHLSNAMLYNRFGYALLCLIMIETLCPVSNIRAKNADFFGGVSSGVAITLAFFLKATYFIVGVILFVAISWVASRINYRRIAGTVVGIFLVAVPVIAYLDFNVMAIISDLLMAARARSENLFLLTFIHKVQINIIYYVALLLMIYQIEIICHREDLKKRIFKYFIIGTIIFVSDMILIFTNMQLSELPLLAMFALLQTDLLIILFTKSEIKGYSNLKGLLLLGYISFLLLPRIGSDVTAIVYGAWQKSNLAELRPDVNFVESRIKQLVLFEGENPSSNGKLYTMYINDGVDLLYKTTDSTETIITMDMTNPFPYILGRKPPLGGIAAVAYNYTLSDNSRPSVQSYFGNANIVMVPKYPALNSYYYDGYFRIYQTGLQRFYHKIAESDRWYLYRRRQ